MKLANRNQTHHEELFLTPAPSAAVPALPAVLDRESSNALQRMFRDPRVLEPAELSALVAQLRCAVEIQPEVPEIRVLYGMALSVDLQVQEALEQLRTAASIDPDCFIARLKFGEILMRLRICTQALEETDIAARLASNAAQSELARRQASTIRTMLREGIERGGYGGLLTRLFASIRKSRRSGSNMVVASE